MSRLYKWLGATKAHIKFLIRCSKSHLVPEGLCSKTDNQDQEIRWIGRKVRKNPLEGIIKLVTCKSIYAADVNRLISEQRRIQISGATTQEYARQRILHEEQDPFQEA